MDLLRRYVEVISCDDGLTQCACVWGQRSPGKANHISVRSGEVLTDRYNLGNCNLAFVQSKRGLK